MNTSNRLVQPAPIPIALIVDPDDDTRKLHALTLEPLAAEIDEAEDGADALAKALVRPPALVLTELRLPRIDGYAFCGLLREEPATRDAVIVVVTGSAMPDEIERARRAGADDVLVKPVDPELIRDRASALVGRTRALPLRSVPAHTRTAQPLDRARAPIADSTANPQRTKSRSHVREATLSAPSPPPELRCPDCDQPLLYEHSRIGGVSARFPEQWDYYRCVRCGAFQYRHRTRRLRRV